MIKIYKKLICILILFSFLSACQSLKDGLEGNKKSKSAEEFLIEKKNPLVLPPDYSKLPVPKKQNNQNNDNEFDLQKILESPDSDMESKTSDNQSLNKSIIDKIKKN